MLWLTEFETPSNVVVKSNLAETVVEDGTLEDEDEPLVNDCAIAKIVDAKTAVEEMKWLEDALTAGESVAYTAAVLVLLNGPVASVMGDEGEPLGAVMLPELSVLLRDVNFPGLWETKLGADSVAVAVLLSVCVERTGSAGLILSDVYVVVALSHQPSIEVFEDHGRDLVQDEVGRVVRSERCLSLEAANRELDRVTVTVTYRVVVDLTVVLECSRVIPASSDE